ncbi:dihydroxyacetone kinase subunit DhaK [Nonomuraea dietziae]|uniref:dihydroxyacetone kinase subunit DhaK n=1 Tax=Nonomuraea dietziae TaxID=65515 RepID=UPI003CD06BCE
MLDDRRLPWRDLHLVPDQVVAATERVDGGAVVPPTSSKNYTGDVMNFELAAELCAQQAWRWRVVLVDDDVPSGLPLHGGAQGHRARRCFVGEDRRSGGGGGRRAAGGGDQGGGGRWWRAAVRVGIALTILRRARRGQAHVRPSRDGGRAGHRHPRRARPPPARPSPPPRPGGRRHDDRRPRGPAAPVICWSGERHGRHPAHRAVHRLREVEAYIRG